MDITGKVIVDKTIAVTEGMNRAKIDLSGVARGIYMLNLNNEHGYNKVKISVN